MCRLLFYAGGQHGSCVDVRKALQKLMEGPPIVNPYLDSSAKHKDTGGAPAACCTFTFM